MQNTNSNNLEEDDEMAEALYEALYYKNRKNMAYHLKNLKK